MASLIQIQETYIARIAASAAREGKRSAGLRHARVKRGARNEATKALGKLGYSDEQARAIIKDAHDMYVLEREAR